MTLLWLWDRRIIGGVGRNIRFSSALADRSMGVTKHKAGDGKRERAFEQAAIPATSIEVQLPTADDERTAPELRDKIRLEACCFCWYNQQQLINLMLQYYLRLLRRWWLYNLCKKLCIYFSRVTLVDPG